MSEENPSSEAPKQSFGSAPGPTESFGSAPAAAESFGSAPGSTESFGSAPGATQTVGSAPPPVEAKPKKKLIRWVGVALLVIFVALAGIVVFTSRDDAVRADVGQCLAGTSLNELNANKLKIVDCAAANASFKVIQKVDNKKYDEGNDACTSPETEAVFWSGKDGEAGTVLCLTSVKK